MRFFADGPSIPDDLLWARDQGRTIFFCGAGVSRARANLPDFFGLADKVVSSLGVLHDSPARKLIEEAREIDKRVGFPGVISADRVFGLLERDFLLRDIQSAVAAALKPEDACDLSAHQTILDLATNPQGDVRLVTTNFDRLFSDCRPDLKAWLPPRLPDPARASELKGITYLHGRTDSAYGVAEGDGFVLSSSEFGNAYLAEAWATSFFREIVQRYVVVFVGYTADDPPVRYLLEALYKSPKARNRMYAFQEGELNTATARWMQKGVEAIPYDPANGHAALWRTLEAWANRARNPDLWTSDLIQSAKQGPEQLPPHVRGQVAHLISTTEGMKSFSNGADPPPAEWLYVFDPQRRFDKPGHSGSVYSKGGYVDPFDLYGLDSDIPPPTIRPDEHYLHRREVPADAWDGLSLTRLDREALQDENLPSIRGNQSRAGQLPPRLSQLGAWIAQVSSQPAAIWWAGHQIDLHQGLKNLIRWRLQLSDFPSTPESRAAWRGLLENWGMRRDNDRTWAEFEAGVRKDGWTSSAARTFTDLLRPYLLAQTNYFMAGRPPSREDLGSIPDLIRREIKYPSFDGEIEVPDDWVAPTTRGLRLNLEQALVLELETGGYHLDQFGPIDQEDDDDDVRFEREGTLSGAVHRYASLFNRLVKLDVQAALREFSAWDETEETIFSRLRIWALGKPHLIEASRFAEILRRIPEASFWASGHQPDLLRSLMHRWPDLDGATRSEIEQRLMSGPPRWDEEETESFATRRAWCILERLHWLSRRGCKLSIDLGAVTTHFSQKAPNFSSEAADEAAAANIGKSGVVRTVTDHSALLGIPLRQILTRASALGGRTETFVEHDPFSGLSAHRPIRAFSVLSISAKEKDFPEWAWRRFLTSDSRKKDKEKLASHIAKRLATYPSDAVGLLLSPIARWVQAVPKTAALYPALNIVIDKCASALAQDPLRGRSGVVRGSTKPDWVMEAINSPVGHLADALLDDPLFKAIDEPTQLPREWQQLANSLLDLPADLGKYALVLLCHHLNLLFWIDPEWAEEKLLSSIESPDEDVRTAAWVGFLWSSKIPNENLFVRVKSALFGFSSKPHQSVRSYSEILVGFLLAGWGSLNQKTGTRYISNDEMRALLLNVDSTFRSRVLWQMNRWAEETRDDPNRTWDDQAVEFLEKVWPRQIAAKTPSASARLVDLALANKKQFPRRYRAVLPLLTPVEGEHLGIYSRNDEISQIVAAYPREMLYILKAVLPEEPQAWPYGIEKLLSGLEAADPALTKDDDFLRLKRKWDSR